MAFSSVSEATIRVQIVSGINIPIRFESLQAIEELNKQINGPQQRQLAGRDAPQFGRGPVDNRGPYPQRDDYDRDRYSRDPRNQRDPIDQRDPRDFRDSRDPRDFTNSRLDRPQSRGYPNDQAYDDYDRRGARTDLDRSYPSRGNQFSRYDRDIRTQFDATNQRDRFRLGDRDRPVYSGYGTVENPYNNTRGFGAADRFNLGGYDGNALGQRVDNRRPDLLGAVGKAKLELTGIKDLIQGSVFVEVRFASDRPGAQMSQIKRTRE